MIQRPTAYLATLTFSGNDTFNFKPKEKIILVGPNNSGKSKSLQEITQFSSRGTKSRYVVIRNLTISKTGTGADLKRFLDIHAEYHELNYRFRDWTIPENHIRMWDEPFLQGGLLQGFLKNVEAADRLQICQQQPTVSPKQQKSKPQHVLYDDPSLMKHISLLFRRAFGEGLMIDFRGGNVIPIHVGKEPSKRKGVDRVGQPYVDAVRRNPLLDEQGDGMKSYAGILLESVVANRDITLIDEPEAFLHPPQMRRLGETLSSEVPGQLIVATHSSDILRGFLEGTKGELRILRISRVREKNFVNEADRDVIRELWEKPVLRYSNALEGVFHEQTILCEDDSDCRLLNATADYLALDRSPSWPDTAYVPTGGKHAVPKIASILRQVGVPIKAVFDLDFLSDGDLVEKAVASFGGSWNSVKPVWTRVDASVRSGVKPKSVEEIKSTIHGLLSDTASDALPKSAIEEELRLGKPWSHVKKYGERAIPRGHAQQDYRKLVALLENIGIYLVPVGEVENFCPEIGLHGPKFVTNFLEHKDFSDQGLSELTSFVEKVHTGAASNVNA